MAERLPKKESLTGLAARLSRLPTDKRRAAMEISASLAGVSLRVSREFVSAVPTAAEILTVDDLRNWGEIGRRLAMGSVDLSVAFFREGVGGLRDVPPDSRMFIFEICKRQLVLSSSIALETFHLVPKLVREIDDGWLASEIFRLAAEIAARSAKHSADLLQRTVPVAASLAKFGRRKRGVAESVIDLAFQFANRTGGMTADLWTVLPAALERSDADEIIKLMSTAEQFLEFGGSVTLYLVESGASVLRIAPEAFDEWHSLARKIAAHGNAVLIAFLRSSPSIFNRLCIARPVNTKRAFNGEQMRRILSLIARLAEKDAESALAAFRSSPDALEKVSLDQFDEWISRGIDETTAGSLKSRRSYFALETRGSNERLHRSRLGLSLESVQPILRIYIEGLTGREVEVASLSAMPQQSRIGDGKTIYLPAFVAEFEDEEID
ncbi:MAG TPA: hypothetical protein VEV84_06345, partial [Pyrinomonadaceae bacterium]|nr:hypothetical protein [Pyrinomonadaceae bacterium]